MLAPTKGGNHDAKRAALDLDLLLISGAPSNHAGRNSTGIWGANRQGCRFSRPAPWMARGGGPPNHWRITGTPSLSEVPSGGARALCLLSRFSKVRRRQGGTLSGRYRRNGYVPGITASPVRPSSRASQLPQLDRGYQVDRCRLSGRHRRQASSHIWIAGCQVGRCRLAGRHRRQASSHIWIAGCQVDRLRLSGRHRRQLPQFDCGAPTLNLPLEPSGPEALRCQRSNVSL